MHCIGNHLAVKNLTVNTCARICAASERANNNNNDKKKQIGVFLPKVRREKALRKACARVAMIASRRCVRIVLIGVCAASKRAWNGSEAVASMSYTVWIAGDATGISCIGDREDWGTYFILAIFFDLIYFHFISKTADFVLLI